MTLGQEITIGPFHFTVLRLLIAVGLVRAAIRGEQLAGGMNRMDWLMLAWSVWALASSIFHKDPLSALVFRLGLAFNACGIYFLIRVFCQSMDDLKDLFRITAILLLPLAVTMLYEKLTYQNLYAFAGAPENPEIRNGYIRAQGPFTHSILAGTAGAVCLPWMVGLWQEHRNLASVGIVACVSMIFASGSSGPIMSAAAGIGALFMWLYRDKMRFVRWIAVLAYVALDIVMKAPAYYLIAKIDLVGGSTGWHRAFLLESAFIHLKEWWLAGTDYTIHWMPTGVPWSMDHTDITNHYLHFGVVGGLPLIFLFIAILATGFSFVGQTLGRPDCLPAGSRFTLWALGSALFVHVVTCISVSYFDQSFVFLYLTLAGIGSAYPGALLEELDEDQPFADSPTSGLAV